MSTILDALRKLQRERAAESPSRDLRGSITNETPRPVPRKRGGRSGWIAALLVLLAVAGGGYWLQQSGRITAWQESRAASALEAESALEAQSALEEVGASEAELAEAEREAAQMAVLQEAQPAPLGEGSAVALPPAATAGPTPPRVDSPEIAAERARLEAALANARAAQEEQAAAELAAARQAAQAAQVAQATPPAPTPIAKPVVKPPAAKKAAAPKPVVAAKSAPRDTPAPAARVEPARAPTSSAFPEVRVESIRWHPIPERRVASLHFEQQDAPEAREGDIVAGVLVYRIDPGAVELHVGSAHRVVSPEP